MDGILNDVLEEKNLIKLSHGYLVFKSANLRNKVIVNWNYFDNEKLTVSKISNDGENDFPHTHLVVDNQHLLLNPVDEGYERVLLLKIHSDENELRFEEVLKPKISQRKFHIIYNG